MKKFIYVLLFLFVFCICKVDVQATSGALRKASIKTCSNGVTYGQHSSSGELHWHVAKADSDVSSGWIATGDPIYSDPCSSSGSSSSSSSDSSSGSDLSNNSNSSSESNSSSGTGSSNNSGASNSSNSSNNSSSSNNTSSSSNSNTSSNESISSNTSSNNSTNASNSNVNSNVAKPSISDIEDKKQDSVDSDNDDVVDTVTEDKKEESNEKDEIDVDEEKDVARSFNTSIKIVINGESVVFDDNNKATVYVSYSVTKVDFDYTLGDSNSNAVYTEIDTINVGDNEINVVVTAEDGSKSEYTINIYRYSKVEDFVYTILALGLLGGIGFAIYKLFSKVKKSISKKSKK